MAFYRDIEKKLNGIDIAIMVNNAGVMYTGNFDETPAQSNRWKDMLDINIMHVGMMTSIFKNKLIARY